MKEIILQIISTELLEQYCKQVDKELPTKFESNSRSGRLLEKWFLGQKLGDKSWFVPSERSYYEQYQTYYKNIRALGIEYTELNYSKALSFLFMLPNSIVNGERKGTIIKERIE